MPFAHFVITQFNLKNFPNSAHENTSRWVDWTRERIKLFNTYCLPSILKQTEKNFTWLLFFDVDTPEEFKYFIQDLTKYPFINVCYCQGDVDFQNNYCNEVKSRIQASTEWIITTRLDNDDVLNKNAIQAIQQNFVEKDKFLISLASGYVMDIEKNILAHYYYPMSPFISLIEKVSNNIVGIYYKQHTHWQSLRLFLWKEIYAEYFNKSFRQSRFILKQPLWIQIYHGKNVSNNFYRGFPVRREINLNDFGINHKTTKMSIREIPKFYNYVVWKRYFKCSIIKLLIKSH